MYSSRVAFSFLSFEISSFNSVGEDNDVGPPCCGGGGDDELEILLALLSLEANLFRLSISNSLVLIYGMYMAYHSQLN